MTKHFVHLAFCVFCIALVFVPSDLKAGAFSPIEIGIETDPLPFVLDGYILAGWVGYHPLRLRALRAQVLKPDFLLHDGFTANRINSTAVLVDYFPFSNDFSAWCASIGWVNWDGVMSEKASGQQLHYSTQLISFDAAYTLMIGEHFYVSPWAALHIAVAGDRTLQFRNTSLHLDDINPEVSVKIGWKF